MSPAPQFKSINSLVLSLIYGTALTSLGFRDSSSGKESACNAGDLDGFLAGKIHYGRDRLSAPVFLGFPCGSVGKEPPAMWETWVRSLGWEDSLKTGKATHSSILP